jgi:preprotein translocase subunit SecA
MLDLVEDLVVDMVGNTCPEGASPAKWDLDALTTLVRDQFGLDVKFSGPPPGRPAEARSAIEEQVYNVVEKAYRAKEDQLGIDADGVPVLRRWEQYIYLQSIDQLWKDHLLAMDHLRQGIGLRGYGQKDPKQEYKKEGYEMFVQMTWRVKSAVVGNILRLQVVRQESAEEIEAKRMALARRQRVTESHGGEADGDGATRSAAKQETVVRATPKVGRNEPCPCGSGKKYKKCHGATEATA